MALKTTYYIIGTLDHPVALIRHMPEPGAMTYGAYDAALDDFVWDVDVGEWIITGDTILTRIGGMDVASVMRKLRIRAGLAPVDPPAVDPDDPFANGLSAVRYEGVFGHRPDPR